MVTASWLMSMLAADELVEDGLPAPPIEAHC